MLGASLRLGLTSFGGPVAHLGYFHHEYVARRRWVDEAAYADLVALCQFLPGPASSQVSIAIGLLRAGLPGALAAWVGFTLPSALALAAFAWALRAARVDDAGWLHGLKVAAVAVVAQAVWGMARSLCPDRERATVAIAAAILVTAWPTAAGQVLTLALAALIGRTLLPAREAGARAATPSPVSRAVGIACLVALAVLLVALPLARAAVPSRPLAVADAFFRTGSLVFGGGHVVLPLLQAEVVPPGWVSPEAFVAGYGAAQAVPGPLFTFAAYLGAVMAPGAAGLGYAALALAAIFLPAFLLVLGALPFWSVLRAHAAARAALGGINAAVVGILLAALYRPVWTSAILGPADLALALAAFALLQFWKTPPWLVVLVAALAAAGLDAFAP